MGYWGWRCIAAVFISVWVVGCSVTHETAPTVLPTRSPYTTLIPHLSITPTPYRSTQSFSSPPVAASPTAMVYVVQPGDTLLHIARQFGVQLSALQAANGGVEPLTLQIGQALSIPDPRFNIDGLPILPTLTPAALSLSPPICYAAPTDYIVCLGQVTNPLEIAIQRVTVWVQLFDQEGIAVAEGEGAVEQSIIPPGGVAPYRLLLRADWKDFAGAAVWLKSADSAPEANDRYVTLDVEDQNQVVADGRYVIRAVLHNPTSLSAHMIRAVVTLTDADQQLMGYRIVQLDRLIAPDERFPIEVAVMPKTGTAAAIHTIYVEAQAVP